MSRRPRGDAGSGLFSTSFAVLVFILFLAFAVHLLTALYATSTTIAVSTDAARTVASRTVDHRDPAAVLSAEQIAEAGAKKALGRLGDQVTYRWTVTATDVRLDVHLVQPWRLGPGFAPMRAMSTVDRTIVVRLEDPS